jgi:ribosomal protein S18 acetylase RimI-like enzyme
VSRLPTVREAKSTDAGEIGPLVRELGYEPQGLQNTLLRIETEPHHTVLVATDDPDGIVGWLELRASLSLAGGSAAEIIGLVVAEGHRNRGLGQSLVQEAANIARSWRVDTLRVRTRIEREGAHRFYERLGFSLAKTQRVYDLDL